MYSQHESSRSAALMREASNLHEAATSSSQAPPSTPGGKATLQRSASFTENQSPLMSAPRLKKLVQAAAAPAVEAHENRSEPEMASRRSLRRKVTTSAVQEAVGDEEI
jgi:hypothetical protein